MGEAPAGPFLFLVFSEKCHIQRLQASGAIFRACRPAQQQLNLRPNNLKMLQPSLIEKRHHQLASSVGTTVPLQIKTDLSVTDGINPEQKQEQRQSTKDAGPAKRRRQQISQRVRSDASQHGQGGGAPPHQLTPDRRVRATHQADATPTRGTTSSGRSLHSSS